VVAGFRYLKTRRDLNPKQIGLLGISQAGWIMPLATVRANDIAFLVSISGAGVPGAETTIDQARTEMIAGATPPPVAEQIIGLMKQEYNFARTGDRWTEYADGLRAATGTSRGAFCRRRTTRSSKQGSGSSMNEPTARPCCDSPMGPIRSALIIVRFSLAVRFAVFQFPCSKGLC
jgi:hypothetical protein